MAFKREVKMKKIYTKSTETMARFVRWIVVGVLSLLVALPIIASAIVSVAEPVQSQTVEASVLAPVVFVVLDTPPASTDANGH
jgi:steroid 5-alpha reductase family enzyme